MTLLNPRDVSVSVARGDIAGHSALVTFGFNRAIAAGAPEDLIEGLGAIPFPVAGEALEVVSDSADDAAAGLGAQVVFLRGLDAGWAEHFETVPTNGLTPVPFPTSFARTNLAFAVASGATGSNVGTITIRTVVGAITRLTIAPTRGQSNSILANVGAGRSMWCTRVKAGFLIGSPPNSQGTVELVTRTDIDTPGATLRVLGEAPLTNVTTETDLVFNPYLGTFTGPADVWLRVNTNRNGTEAYGILNMYAIDDTP